MLSRLVNTLLLGCAVSAWDAAWAGGQPDVHALEVKVERIDGADGGKVYLIASSGRVAARPDAVWRVLTDYDRLSDYVPDLKSSRTLARNGNQAIVEQLGSPRFLFFNRDIRLVVQVDERAPDRIDVNLVDGDMKTYRCSWELIPAISGGTQVVYHATIEPKFYVPELVGTGFLREHIARMMTAVLQRLDREPPG